MSRKILWLENDAGWVQDFKDALEQSDCEVTLLTRVSEAEKELSNKQWDLLILDVMIPTKGLDEEIDYPPSETDAGHDTGLLFYRRNREVLRKAGTPVLAFTVRMDKEISDAFRQAGLPEDCFATKLELRNVDVFLRRIEALVEKHTETSED